MFIKTWTPEQEQYLRDHYMTMSNKEMARAIGKTGNAVKLKCGVMRLLKPLEAKNAILKRCAYEANKDKMLTPQEEEFVKENYLTIPIKSIAKILGKGQTAVRGGINRLGLVIPPELAEYRKAINQKRKGDIPFNKGLPQISYMTPESIEKTIASRFQKGINPYNTVEIGTEAVTKDGYIKVKVGEPNVWAFKQRLVWQQHFGEIPAEHMVIFKDDNILNFDIHNLDCIDRRLHVRRPCVAGKYQIERDNLSDHYVADIIKRRTALHRDDIPQNLINLKRSTLKINRELKKIVNNESK